MIAKVGGVFLVLMASQASAEGLYVGGFGSGGAFQEMGPSGPNESQGSVMAGGFAGYAFDFSALQVSPEVRLRAAAKDQVRYDYTDTASFPGFTAIDRLRFREKFAAEVGVNVGVPIRQFTPYVGASVGGSRLQYKSTFVVPWHNSSTAFRDSAITSSVRAGAEYNFDRYFARAEIEQRWFHREGWQTYRKTEVSLGFGVRF